MKKIFTTLLFVAFFMPMNVWAETDSAKSLENANSAYKKAQQTQKASDYQKALQAFQVFLKLNEGKHVGSTGEMMEDCQQKIYNIAISLYQQAKNNPKVKDLNAAKSEFEILSGYKNAQAYADSCARCILGGAGKVKLANSSKVVNFDNTGKQSAALVFEKTPTISNLKVKTPDWLSYNINEEGVITLKAKHNPAPKARKTFVVISGEINTAKGNNAPVMSGVITYCQVIQDSNETVFLPVIELKPEGGNSIQLIKTNDEKWSVPNANPKPWLEVAKENDQLKLIYTQNDGEKREADFVIVTTTGADKKELKFHVIQDKYVPQPVVPQPTEVPPVDKQPAESLSSTIEKVNKTAVSDYAFGSTQITTEQVKELVDVYELLNQNENLTVTIYGNTCSIGSDEANQKIGLQRAENAKNFLVYLGIAPERISVASNGESAPVADNKTAEGRAKNRRLTFEVK